MNGQSITGTRQAEVASDPYMSPEQERMWIELSDVLAGVKPFPRDKRMPLGHAMNPVPPGKLSEPDWMAKLRERMKLEEDRSR